MNKLSVFFKRKIVLPISQILAPDSRHDELFTARSARDDAGHGLGRAFCAEVSLPGGCPIGTVWRASFGLKSKLGQFRFHAVRLGNIRKLVLVS